MKRKHPCSESKEDPMFQTQSLNPRSPKTQNTLKRKQQPHRPTKRKEFLALNFKIFDIDEIVAMILQFMTTTDYFVCLRFINRCFHRVIEEGILSGLIFKNITLDYLSPTLTFDSDEHHELVTIQQILEQQPRSKKRKNSYPLPSKLVSKSIEKDISSSNGLHSQRLLDIISKHAFAIQSWHCAYGVREMTCHVFDQLMEKCKNLQEICVESPQLESIKISPQSLPHLRHLSLVMRSFSFHELVLGEEKTSSVKKQEEIYTSNLILPKKEISNVRDELKQQESFFEHLATLSITIHRYDDSFKTLFTHSKLFPNLVHFTFHTTASTSSTTWWNPNILPKSTNLIHLWTPRLETVSLRVMSKHFIFNGQVDHHMKLDSMQHVLKLTNLEYLQSMSVLLLSSSHVVIPSVFLYHCPNLIHVNLPMGHNRLCPITKFMLSHLKEIELDVAEMIHDELEDGSTLTWMSMIREEANLPSLQHLRLYSSSEATIQSLELKGFKQLRSLTIELENIDLTVKNMKKLREVNISCKDLKLHLYKCKRITEKVLDQILDNSKISSLTISKCSELRRIDLSKNSHNRYLRHFNINKCPNLEWLCCDSTRTVMSGEVKNCTNLKYIKATQLSINTSPTRYCNKMLLVTNAHPKLEIISDFWIEK